MKKKIKVIVVDDSRLFREIIKQRLSGNANIEVVGTASDAAEAKEMIEKFSPDALILDITMPRVDGIMFLRQCNLPCIMVSNAEIDERELIECGAAAFLHKPQSPSEMVTFINVLCTKIISAVSDRTSVSFSAPGNTVLSDERNPIESGTVYKKNTADVFSDSSSRIKKPEPVYPAREDVSEAAHRVKDGYVIALGASTGGTDALECVIRSFSADMPPILVVQHMPPVFTNMYAERLNKTCRMNVREAVDGYRIKQGDCIIGAGGYHLELKKDAMGYYIKSTPGEKVSGHCPSVDVLFSSVAETAGNKAIAAILTGMGADGAKGLLKIRKSGGYTIGQDKESCVVYGMPMEAYKIGACCEQQPLTEIGAQICRKLAAGWR